MNSHRSIAVAQTCPDAGNVAANVAEHLSLVELAAAGGAVVVVFPELSLTGYEIHLAPTLAFKPRDPRLQPLVDAAADLRITLLVGAPVASGSGLRIGTLVVGPDRSVQVYTKRRLGAFSVAAHIDGNPPAAESTIFRPGSSDPLIPVGEGWAAAAICADIGDPAHPRAAAERGATTYLVSMLVIPSEYDSDAARLERYAAEHGLVVAMANHGAPTGGMNAAGRSAIWSARGELLVELAASGAGVAVALETSQEWQIRRKMVGEAGLPVADAFLRL